MKIAVFGASRGIGLQFALQALEAGHAVQALVRDPAGLDSNLTSHPQFKQITGSADDPEAVRRTVEGAESVIVSLGPKPGPGMTPEQLSICSRSTPILLNALKETRSTREKLRRLIVVTSMGTGSSAPFITERSRMVLKPFLDDKEIQERLVMESNEEGGMPWIIVRPGGLRDGERTGGRYVVGDGLQSSMVVRADVAEAMMKMLEDDQWVGKTPSVVGVQ
ncbi:hypothetical protein HDV05_001926 [Chytridiales sp. JEL 0842]|nr:hypothetical protein HDV05_001926 [Chytridiales sp. JEL 0842]